MKGTGKIMFGVMLMTGLMLLYVHGQVTLFLLSYAIERKSTALAQKAEFYQHLKFEVDQLKAPRRLEQKMAELSMELTLPEEFQVVRIQPPSTALHVASVGDIAAHSVSHRLSSMLSKWMGVAQAKTES